MSNIQRRLSSLVVHQTKSKADSSVIFLHGSGDSSSNLIDWLKAVLGQPFSFPTTRVIFPDAPARPYTAAGGAMTKVWFDRKQISPFVPEDEVSTNQMIESLTPIVKEELNHGIEPSKIIIGGFSMGAAMALHLSVRQFQNIAGMFVLSGFLSPDSQVLKTLKSENGSDLRLFYAHGDKDPLVPVEWGQQTYQRLTDLGLQGEFHKLSGVYHELQKTEIILLKNWISKLLSSS